MIPFNNIKTIVQGRLEADPTTRNSDNILYVQVCECINPVVRYLPFSEVFSNSKKYGIPGFETVRRTRQKIQQHNPDLGANTKAEEARELLEDEYKSFARKVMV